MRLIALSLLIFLTTVVSVKAQHTVVFKDQRQVKGVVISMQYDTLTMISDGQLLQYHMREISSLFFDEFVAYDGQLLDDEVDKTVWSGDYQIRYKIKDREMTRIPKITCGTLDKGTVVVTIEVDRYGNVMKAVPGGTGSTTTNAYLYAKAQFAAMEARFNTDNIAPIRTKGTIAITY